jgi:hypothetical protein
MEKGWAMEKEWALRQEWAIEMGQALKGALRLVSERVPCKLLRLRAYSQCRQSCTLL